MIWQKITLNRNQIEAGAIEAIRREFQKVYDADQPEGAALLVSRFPDQTGAREVFFSPPAADLLQSLIDGHSGIPCNPPASRGVDVLGGSVSILNRLDRAA